MEHLDLCPACLKYHTEPHPVEGWVGFDFDGTVATAVVDRTDPYMLGKPVSQTVGRIKTLIKLGYEVRLLTVRMNEVSHLGIIRDLDKMERLLTEWCIKHIGQPLKCTNQKDENMIVLWDDRAVQVIKNTGDPLALLVESYLRRLVLNEG